jgi:hypothetical protein
MALKWIFVTEGSMPPKSPANDQIINGTLLGNNDPGCSTGVCHTDYFPHLLLGLFPGKVFDPSDAENEIQFICLDW